MSEIHVKEIDAKVTEKQLKLLFREFGSIESLDYKHSSEKKCNGRAIIIFKNENSAAKAMDYDGIELCGHAISVHIIKNGKGVQESKKQQKLFNFHDILLILLVAVISIILHFPRIEYPKEIVFDETHFGGFISGYITGVRFFDIHPPLAKLMLAAWAKYACGYNGTFDFKRTFYNNSINYVRIRLFPCFFGSMVAPILTASMILRRCSYPACVLTGLLFAFDFTSIVQSRFILTDAIVYFFVAMTIFFSCMLSRRENWLIIILGAFFGSAAFCSKFAAGGALLFFALCNFRLCIRRQYGFLTLCFRGIASVIILVSLLFGTIYIHLKLTPIKGFGDNYNIPSFRRKSTMTQIRLLLWDMYRYNRDLGFDHPYQSRWYEWPIFKAIPTLLWSEKRLTKAICLFNNPVSCITSLIGALACAYSFNFEWFIAWCASFLPFSLVKRCTWTYHYEIPLIFGICGFSFIIDRLPKHFRRALYALVFCSLIAAFAFWMPWLYAIEVPYKRVLQMTIWPYLRSFWNL